MADLVPQPRHDPTRLAVLISGSGTTLANLLQWIDNGQLNASVAAVISSKEQVKGLQIAESRDIPSFVVPRKTYDDVAAFSQHLFGLVRDAEADLVCLAGFLSLLHIPDDFYLRVINIHPALLPAFGGPGMYGKHVHAAVLEAGCKVSGCTVHFCDQSYDTGPIIAQRTCPVDDADTPESLAERVFEQECIAYPEAIEKLASERLEVSGRRTQRVR
jgi:formyltetrahydrofolate-dependent phosphoribosylglycinamide formyltransferase